MLGCLGAWLSSTLACAGVDNNETIKVSRSGGADPDGNQPGDLYVFIKVNYHNYIKENLGKLS